MTDHLPYWLASLYLPNVGPRRFLQWLTYFSNIEALYKASADELVQAGVPAKFIPALLQPDWQQVEKDLRWQNQNEQFFLTLSGGGL